MRYMRQIEFEERVRHVVNAIEQVNGALVYAIEASEVAKWLTISSTTARRKLRKMVKRGIAYQCCSDGWAVPKRGRPQRRFYCALHAQYSEATSLMFGQDHVK